VGQPRDRDPRATYVIWDLEENSFLFKRVPYDVSAVAKRIEERGIPSIQARRLNLGR
jgi:diadenosine tetraphosphatase ApaH/serine/threonine PP2A family protein phosphatase